jgi:hypothetical protein
VNKRPVIFIHNIENPEFILMIHKSLVTVYVHNSLKIREIEFDLITVKKLCKTSSEKVEKVTSWPS